MDAATIYSIGIILVFIGIAIILVAIISLFLSHAKESGKAQGGGVIIIGPFPIIFGTDKKSVKMLLLLSLILSIFLAVLTVIFYFMFR